MISQSITLHPESTPYKYEGPINQYTQPTQFELDAALDEAMKAVQVGDKFKYKNGKDFFVVVGFIDKVGININKYKGSLSIIQCKRNVGDNIINYSMAELFGEYMEVYKEEGQQQC